MWQDFIDLRLNYQNNLPRLVTDQTGILYSSVYLSWLANKNVEVKRQRYKKKNKNK